MLVWKCWRDLRIAFFCGLGWLGLMAAGVLCHAATTHRGISAVWANPGQSFRLLAVFFGVQTFIFMLVGFAMGTAGVGREIGAGSGSYLLSRPLPRGRYVWTEWMTGLAALAVLLLLSSLGLWLLIRSYGIRISSVSRSGNTMAWHSWMLPTPPLEATAMYGFCGFLFIALMFGLTHLGTTAFRNSTAGLLSSVGFLIVWVVATTMLRHHEPWLTPYIPSLLLHPYGGDPERMRLIPGLAASLLERMAILPLLPLAGQLLLRRAEV